MSIALAILVPLALAAVAFVLVMGLMNMARGGSPQRSQKLMQMRVMFQFAAIVLVMALIWAAGGS